MAYIDRADWHWLNGYPQDLSREAAATRPGMFVAWAIFSGLGGGDLMGFEKEIVKLKNRTITPGQFFIEACDCKFMDDNLSAEGNAFVAANYYYVNYCEAYYEKLIEDLPTFYHIADSWENFDRIKPFLDELLAKWRVRQMP